MTSILPGSRWWPSEWSWDSRLYLSVRKSHCSRIHASSFPGCTFFSLLCMVPAVTLPRYPRSPKALLGDIAHLARFIDKIRMRDAGLIQDYNYITTGFDKHLIDFLRIDAKAFEQRVLAGGTDEEFLAWVMANGRLRGPEENEQWNHILLSSRPKDDAARQRFQGRLKDIATKRGVPVESLPSVSTWADVIELDEERM